MADSLKPYKSQAPTLLPRLSGSLGPPKPAMGFNWVPLVCASQVHSVMLRSAKACSKVVVKLYQSSLRIERTGNAHLISETQGIDDVKREGFRLMVCFI